MIYTYRRKDNDEIVELWMSIEEMEQRQQPDGTIILDDGAVAVRDIVAEKGGFRHVPEKEIRSDALGCHPSQVDDFEKSAAEMGVPTQFDRRTGEALFSGRTHRNRYMRAMNSGPDPVKYVDRDAGYGDPQ